MKGHSHYKYGLGYPETVKQAKTVDNKKKLNQV